MQASRNDHHLTRHAGCRHYDPEMIAGAHTILFAEDADRARAFIRDVLGFEGVDGGDGWLIFALPPSELAVHPGSGAGPKPGHHLLFFMCHDIDDAVAQLTGKGVEFVSPIEDQRWGRVAQFKIPGAGEVGLYEPAHPSPLAEFAGGD
jgi:catechol 2,3-dioxygenase-like lactoylglutathione lyase family enzyme